MPEYLKILVLLLSQLPVIGGVVLLSKGTISRSSGLVLVIAYEIGVLVIAFWRKVWTRWEGRLADLVAQKGEDVVSYRLFRRRYMEQVVSDYAPFNVKGMDSINPLRLEHVFVDVRIEGSTAQVVKGSLFKQKNVEDLAGNRSIWDFITLAQSPEYDGFSFAIIGAPGSGKTTLLQNIALTMAGGESKKRGVRSYLPITLFLREHGDSIVKDQRPLHELLEEHFKNAKKFPTLEPPTSFFKEQLREGECLILLDGLDEVANSEERKTVSEWADIQIKSYPRCRFIVTSRPQGYKVAPFQTARVLEVMPFNLVQVQKFIENWYQAHAFMRGDESTNTRNEANEDAQSLIQKLRMMPALNEMTVNPLLLTMIVIVHHYHGALPGSREKLYSELCDVLLERRDAAKKIKTKFEAKQSLAALRPLAAFMMENKVRDVSFDTILNLISEPLENAGIADADVQTFPTELELSSGLLLEAEPGRWSFAHLSFQEYLAAAHWLGQIGSRPDWEGLVGETWWYDTIRFYAAQTDATEIARACLKVNSPQALVLLADFTGRGTEVMSRGNE